MFRIARGITALLYLAVSTSAVHAAQRVYVASTGVDSAPCTLAQPCRSFAAALAAVDAGGEIVALDAAGYGAVNITKSVTITTNPGVFAGIAAATGTAVTINAPDGLVTLRGLQINGTGASNGIVATSAERVVVENCVISNFATQGINATGTELHLSNSIVLRNTSGFVAGTGLRATMVNSQFVGNVLGVLADDPARITISDSVATGNQFAFVTGPGAFLSAMRVTATHNTQAAFVNNGGIVLVGSSHVSNNQGYGFRNDEGLFGSMGNNQLAGNTLGSVIGGITPTPSF